jgi:hypothetical protein
MSDVVLVIDHIRNSDCWRVTLLETGQEVLPRARLPLLAGARRLIELGYDPATLATMRHRADGVDCFMPKPWTC